MRRITVILPPEEADRLDAYCRDRGYKKSTLLARLVREQMDRDNFRQASDKRAVDVSAPRQVER